ncbi:hypothetical protein J3B02_000692 [Coemansia erecta]|uniref:Acyltransferase n=1 Tax=Coemansia asiatica TaxID=1052880 RepID=A0A9W7XPJ9_9FUNG|nr:hypothetical protein LPJ64_001495 [Coemansia asiatica]KAJ2857862.1 hypothetical protein J3B02_000692 [Coemansia erecta]KAJ2879262.1 hypothetical protein FB639_003134 [Coemansia asiatica]
MDISCIIDDIQPASFRLSEQDALMSLFNHPLVHFYQNTDRKDDFMPTKRLQQALVLALKEFSILLGHVQKADAGLDRVAVDRNHINNPEFTESFSSIHYSDLLSAQFNWSVWPDGVASAGATVAPSSDGSIKLLSVHLTRLADNSGVILFCNIPHYIVDGFGYYEFLSRWACVCRELSFTNDKSNNIRAKNVSEQSLFLFDRETALKSLQSQYQLKPLGPLVNTIFKKDSVASRLFASLRYTSRLRITSIGMRLRYGLASWFWIPAEKVDLLLKLVIDDPTCHLSKHEISNYALVTALIDTAFVRAQRQMASECSLIAKVASFVGGILAKLLASQVANEHILINMVHTRHHLEPLDGYYFGNPIFLHPISMQTKHVAEENAKSSFIRLALTISQELRSIDGPAARGFVDMVCANPSAHARFTAFASTASSALTVVDERSYKMDSVDFGNGGPAWISGIQLHMPNMVALFQQPAPMHNGIAVFASLEPGIARLIASDPFFSLFAKLL